MVADAASLMSEGDQDAAELIEAMQAQQETQVRYPPPPLRHPYATPAPSLPHP